MKKCHALLKDIFVEMPSILIQSYFTIKNGESTLSKIELLNTTVCTCNVNGSSPCTCNTYLYGTRFVTFTG